MINGRGRSRGRVDGRRGRGATTPTGRSRAARWRAGLSLFVGVGIAVGTIAAGARADDAKGAPASSDDETIATLSMPDPGLVIDRLTDPMVQQSLSLLPPYRRFREGPEFTRLAAVVQVVAGQLHTTWDRGLRDLTGGGISARVAAMPGGEPRIELVVTPDDAGLLKRAAGVFAKLARDDARDRKAPDPIKTADHRGIVVSVVGGDNGPAYAVVAGRLAVAGSSKHLERLIDRLLASQPAAGGPAALGVAKASPRGDAEPAVPPARGPGDAGVILRGHVDLARLRKLDPAKYAMSARPDAGVVFLFGGWYHAFKQATAIDASIRWPDNELAARVDLTLPEGSRPASVKGFMPGPGQGTLPSIRPPGTIASLSLWRDWATIWESRSDLLAPEVVQGLTQLDGLTGQLFGGREFGADVLSQFDPHWRLIVARQDDDAMRPAPDVKLPAFAVVAELNGSQEDFAARLKVAFQSLVGISNIESAQKKGPVVELASEEVDGVTIATTRHVVPRSASTSNEPGPTRYNFTPAAAHVGRHFIVSSGTGLARSLVRQLKASAAGDVEKKPSPATFTAEADGPELARLLERNRGRLVMQTMLDRGENKAGAERRVDLYLALLRYLGTGRLVVEDRADRTRLDLTFALSRRAE